jgi:TetR/AcrR family transcriptional repressor of nem operon
MRYSEKHKEQTRERIVRTASRRFRGKGEGNVAIADLMQELKLTHGGFYRHFSSKEDLFAESITKAFEEAAARMRQRVKDARPRPGSELKTFIEVYLSPEHCARTAEGCPLAALATEVARHPRTVRSRFDKAVQSMSERLSKFIKGSTEDEKRRNVAVLMSGMAGAVNLARAVADDETRQRILQDARDFYVRSFC